MPTNELEMARRRLIPSGTVGYPTGHDSDAAFDVWRRRPLSPMQGTAPETLPFSLAPVGPAPPPPGGANLGPRTYRTAIDAERDNAEQARQIAIQNEEAQRQYLAAQRGNLEAETATRRRGLEPVELEPGRRVDPRAVEYETARVEAEGRKPLAPTPRFRSSPQGIFNDITGAIEHPAPPEAKDPELDEAAINMAAEVYVRTGNMPALGMGSTGLRQKILNRAGQIAGGSGAAVVGNRAAYSAGTQALGQLQKQYEAVSAFEATALKNLDLFTNQAKQVIDSGSPWINRPLRSVSERGMGSAELAAFNTARQVALTEIARVVANPNLTGVLSDTARGEISELLSPDATLVQINAAAEILKQDMSNRKQSLEDQLGSLQGRITAGPNAAPQPQGPAAPQGGGQPMFAVNPNTKERIMSTDGGQTWQPAR